MVVTLIIYLLTEVSPVYLVLVLEYFGKSSYWFFFLEILVTDSSVSSLKSWTDMKMSLFSGSFILMLLFPLPI